MSVSVEKCLQAWTNSLKQMNVNADIVFYGDSLTFHGNFASVFPDKIVCNLGLRGDTLQGMIERVGQVKLLKPRSVYLMAGINDVAWLGEEEFCQKYEELVKSIMDSVPDARLVVQSLLPVNDIDYSISCNNIQISASNAIVCHIADKYHLPYIDLFKLYSKEMELHQNLTVDGIHLHPEAYQLWYNALRHDC